MTTIRPKERDAVIQSLRAGVVPRQGQRLIQVGRARELDALLKDIDRIADGGSAFRLLVGDYGSGKSFLLSLVRAMALERKLVTMHADFTPQRRLHGGNGQTRSLYAELTKNMATRTKPEGAALQGVIEKFVSKVQEECQQTGSQAESAIRRRLLPLGDMVHGFDFATVIAAYCKGHTDANDQLQGDAVRWLRGEFTTKGEARQALGVRSIVDDATVYDQLKLLARFVRIAGYAGLLVCLDEAVNLYKIANAQARNMNFEEILRILNDALQGSAEGLGFIIGGTVEFVTDPRRGLYSYQALQSRLADNSFAGAQLVDYSGAQLRLDSLTAEDFYVLLRNLRHVYASGDPMSYLVPDEALTAFMAHCASRLGNSYFRSPRTTVTTFINFLSVLEQNPGAQWQKLLGQVTVNADNGADADKVTAADSEMAEFKL